MEHILMGQVALTIKGMSHKRYRAYEVENKTMTFEFRTSSG